MSDKKLLPLPADVVKLRPVAQRAKEIEIDLAEFDMLQAEVCVLRDANAALARDRDRLAAECEEWRAALKRSRRAPRRQ